MKRREREVAMGGEGPRVEGRVTRGAAGAWGESEPGAVGDRARAICWVDRGRSRAGRRLEG